LVNVRVLGANMPPQFVHRPLQGGGSLPLQLGDHAQRDRQAEQVVGQLPHATLADAVTTAEERQHRLQPRAKGALRNIGGQRGGRWAAWAVGASGRRSRWRAAWTS